MATTSVSVLANIKLLHEDEMTVRFIAARLHMPRSTVQDIISKLKKTGSIASGKSPGRPRITTRQTDNVIRQAAVKNAMTSASAIQAALPEQVAVSTRTIRRRLLNDCGLRSFRPAAKPRLSAKNIKDRL